MKIVNYSTLLRYLLLVAHGDSANSLKITLN